MPHSLSSSGEGPASLMPTERLRWFVPLVAHDLKGPLRRLEHLAEEAGRRQRRNRRARTDLELLIRQARRARDLVDELLNWCRMPAPHGVAARIDLAPFIRGVWEEIARPPSFRLVLDCRIERVITDPAALGIVLRNLLANAVGHHDRQDGTVEVQVYRWRRRLKLRVIDDGPGMSPVQRRASEELLSGQGQREPKSGIGLQLVAEALRCLEGSGRIRPAGRRRGTMVEIELPYET